MHDFKKSDESAVSRRTFLSMSGIGAAGIALASNMTVAHAAEQTAAESGTPSFLLAPEPISDDQISETMEYDVVVIGAGTSGVPAAMAARKEGARVAVLQKVGAAVAQGGSAACATVIFEARAMPAAPIPDMLRNVRRETVDSSDFLKSRMACLLTLGLHRSSATVRCLRGEMVCTRLVSCYWPMKEKGPHDIVRLDITLPSTSRFAI